MSDNESTGIEWVRERRDKLEEIAESDLPAADVAQRILTSLDEQGEQEEVENKNTEPWRA